MHSPLTLEILEIENCLYILFCEIRLCEIISDSRILKCCNSQNQMGLLKYFATLAIKEFTSVSTCNSLKSLDRFIGCIDRESVVGQSFLFSNLTVNKETNDLTSSASSSTSSGAHNSHHGGGGVSSSIAGSSVSTPAIKPPYTYTELIEQALSEKGPLTVAEIYRWIS